MTTYKGYHRNVPSWPASPRPPSPVIRQLSSTNTELTPGQVNPILKQHAIFQAIRCHLPELRPLLVKMTGHCPRRAKAPSQSLLLRAREAPFGERKPGKSISMLPIPIQSPASSVTPRFRWVDFKHFYVFLFLFLFCFLGLQPQHMEVPRLGVESEPQP